MENAGAERLYTTAEAAAQLGRARSTIQELARTHGIGRVYGNVRLFTAAELAALGGRRPGRPKRQDSANGSDRRASPQT